MQMYSYFQEVIKSCETLFWYLSSERKIIYVQDS